MGETCCFELIDEDAIVIGWIAEKIEATPKGKLGEQSTGGFSFLRLI